LGLSRVARSVYFLVRLRVFHEVGTCGRDRSEQKDAVYHRSTVGNIVANVANSYTYDVQLEIKSGGRCIQLACESFFEPAPGRLGARILGIFSYFFCGFFRLLAVDPTFGIRGTQGS
jgi:hypothetical protein